VTRVLDPISDQLPADTGFTPAAAGLTVPRTLVTNDPDAAARFADQVGPVAVKSFGPNHVADGDSYTIAFARQMTADDLHHASIAATAHQFQQWIDADHAVRLTAVNGRTFAAAIHAHSDAARIDWRSDYSSLTDTTCVGHGECRDNRA
jgi:hypothetical protein